MSFIDSILSGEMLTTSYMHLYLSFTVTDSGWIGALNVTLLTSSDSSVIRL